MRRRALFLALALVAGTIAGPAAAQYDDEWEAAQADEAEPDGPAVEEVFEVPAGAQFAPAAPVPSLAGAHGLAESASLYDELPDPARCSAGRLSDDAKQRFLGALNAMRARHGLAPVAYNAGADAEAAEAALIMTANKALSHFPPRSWACWTGNGAHAAGSSNLLGSVASPSLPLDDDNAIIAAWLIEGDGDEIGHRRWLLDPYLEQTALGRVIAVLAGGVRVDSAVMKVFDFPAASSGRQRPPKSVPAFVAWPQGDYPAQFFSPGARMSFSISQDPNELTKVNSNHAKVTISDGEHNLPVHDQLWDSEGFGVANCLSWRVDGIVPGRIYQVTISGVSGAPRDQYSYSFRIIA